MSVFGPPFRKITNSRAENTPRPKRDAKVGDGKRKKNEGNVVRQKKNGHFKKERKKPWLFSVYRGWNPTQLCRDYFINHEKDPY